MSVCIIGGGAAGVFAALRAKERCPCVTIFEQSNQLLSKVLLSGGGRCNFTNSCFDPKILSSYYPRGYKELIGPFHTFGPKETMDWFEARGVSIKTEPDGRVFPVSNRSETIRDCLLTEARRLGVTILTNQQLSDVLFNEGKFYISTQNETISCDKLLIATGSSHSGYVLAEKFGHTIIDPIPSLFSVHIENFPLSHVSGVAVDAVSVRLVGSPFVQRGAILVTHLGFSGPSILKLSSWAARHLHDKAYQVELSINWLPDLSVEQIFQTLLRSKSTVPQKFLSAVNPFFLPQSLWKEFCGPHGKKLQDCHTQFLRALANKVHDDRYTVNGKSPNKQEFVTCGGVCTSEVNWKTMESKRHPHLYFAGEVLDIDGVTGGFNLQNAWTTGYIGGTSLWC